MADEVGLKKTHVAEILTNPVYFGRLHRGEPSDGGAPIEPELRDRVQIVQALFEQVEVLDPNEVWLYPSGEAEARGCAAAMTGEFGVEERKTGRGERS